MQYSVPARTLYILYIKYGSLMTTPLCYWQSRQGQAIHKDDIGWMMVWKTLNHALRHNIETLHQDISGIKHEALREVEGREGDVRVLCAWLPKYTWTSMH